jgi:tetratricopeptide (TPR) repeat protein
MSLTIGELTSAAIKSALNKRWEEAIEYNKQIIDLAESNKNVTLIIESKLRTGFAYLQLQDFKNSKKYYSDVLELDPINKIALEKMKSVKEKKAEEFIIPDTDMLLKEPGSSVEVSLEILTKGVTADKFKFGEELVYKINNKTISIHKASSNSLINYLPENIVKYLLKAEKMNAEITIKFIGGKDKKIKIIINSSESVFPSEKQDIRPYVKTSDDMDIQDDHEEATDSELVIKKTEDAETETTSTEEESESND